MSDLVWSETVPSVDAYLSLRQAAGMGAFSQEAAERGLANTLHVVCLHRQDALIAMGRLIGDGGCFAQITDIAVHPAWQGQGLGTQVMRRLLEWADAALPQGCYISLIADPGAERLYQKVGFTSRHGMARTVP